MIDKTFSQRRAEELNDRNERIRFLVQAVEDDKLTNGVMVDLAQRWGVSFSVVELMVSEAKRIVAVAMDPNEIKSMATDALQRIAAAAEQRGDYKSAIMAITKVTELHGVMVKKSERTTTNLTELDEVKLMEKAKKAIEILSQRSIQPDKHQGGSSLAEKHPPPPLLNSSQPEIVTEAEFEDED